VVCNELMVIICSNDFMFSVIFLPFWPLLFIYFFVLFLIKLDLQVYSL
jgi:hypothetical protein